MLLDPQCTGKITSSRHPLCLEITFCPFLLRLSRIKPSQVMYMVKFGPTVLNFGYVFSSSISTFFGTPCILIFIILIYFTFHWKLFFKIVVSGEDDNYFIRIVLVEKHHLNLPSSPCIPDPNYNFRACVYEKVLIHIF